MSKKPSVNIILLGLICFCSFSCQSIPSKNNSASLLKGRVLAKSSDLDFKHAVEEYKAALRDSKDPESVGIELARLFMERSQFSKASDLLGSFNGQEAQRLLAQSYYRDGKFTDALTLFSKLGETGDDDYLLAYAMTCEYHNLYDKAEELYKKVTTAQYKSLADERIRLINESKLTKDGENLDERVKSAIASSPNAQDLPQAGAVILFVDEDVELKSDGSLEYTQHYLIKVLNDRGRKYAEVDISYDSTYDKVVIDLARVIRPDGKVVTVGAKHIRDVSRYMNFPLYSNARAKIISMPEVTDNSFIEYEVKVTHGKTILDGEFNSQYFLQSSEPIKEARFRAIVPKGKKFDQRVLNEEYNFTKAELHPRVTHEDQRDIYTWSFKDIPQIIPEPGMPPTIEITPVINLSTFHSWEQIYRWWKPLAQDKIEASFEIKTKVQELTKGKTTLKDKVRALYNFCAKDIRYVAIEYGEAGYEPHQASEIFSNKYGDCKDKAILLISMLKEIGVKAYPVTIATRGTLETTDDFPAVQFNHAMALVELDGEQIFLDPTAETALFGDLPGSDQGRKVLVYKDNSGELMMTPKFPAEHNRLETKTVLTFDDNDSIQGHRQVETQGSFDQSQRYTFRYTMPKLIEEGIKERIQNIVPGGKLLGYNINNSEGMEKNISVTYDFVGTDFLIKAGVQARIVPKLATISTGLVSKDSRQYPIDFYIPQTQQETILIKLPSGYRLKYLPEPLTKESPWFKYQNGYQYDRGTITFSERHIGKDKRVDPKDYAEYKNIIEGLSKDVRQCIILEKVDNDAKQKRAQK